MKASRHALGAIVLFLATLALTAEPCRATTITLDLKNVVWNFDNSSESFNLDMSGARGNLTFAMAPNANYIPSVPTTYAAVEKGLVIHIDDRPDWQLYTVQADFHFNGASLDVNVKATQELTYNNDLSSPPGLQAMQTFWTGADNRASYYAWVAASGGHLNLDSSQSVFHFTFQNDGKQFSPMTIVPMAFLEPPPSYYDTPSGGNPAFGILEENPEPTTIALVGAGLGILSIILRRRNGQTLPVSE